MILIIGPPQALLDNPPSADVARFLGFDGELRDGEQVLLTRPAHVRLGAGGDRDATVTRVIPLEDGLRVELSLDGGRVYAVVPIPGPAVGDRVRFGVSRGVRCPA